MNLQQQIGNKIKELRNQSGITQEKLSELADLDISFISEIESGKRNITVNTIEKLAKAFNIKPSDFITDTEIKDIIPKKELIKSISDILQEFDYEVISSIFTILKSKR